MPGIASPDGGTKYVGNRVEVYAGPESKFGSMSTMAHEIHHGHGYYNLDWFKKEVLPTPLYKRLTGKEKSLTTNILAATVLKYYPNGRIDFLLGINDFKGG